MNITIKPVTHETICFIKQAAWTVKEAQDQFCQAYDMCLTDLVGKGWKKSWQTWINRDEVIESVEKQMKDVCLGTGMKLTVFNRYRTAARKWAFHDVPFVMGANFAVGEIKKAETLAKSYPDGSHEERINRAYKEIRAGRNLKSAKQQVSKKGTFLEWPDDQEEGSQYVCRVASMVLCHLTSEKVADKLGDEARDLIAALEALVLVDA